MVLVLKVVVYELALAFVLLLLPLWFALGPGTELGILAEAVQGPGLLLALAGFARPGRAPSFDISAFLRVM